MIPIKKYFFLKLITMAVTLFGGGGNEEYTNKRYAQI